MRVAEVRIPHSVHGVHVCGMRVAEVASASRKVELYSYASSTGAPRLRDADRGRPHRRGAAHIGKFAETGEIALLGFHIIHYKKCMEREYRTM